MKNKVRVHLVTENIKSINDKIQKSSLYPDKQFMQNRTNKTRFSDACSWIIGWKVNSHGFVRILQALTNIWCQDFLLMPPIDRNELIHWITSSNSPLCNSQGTKYLLYYIQIGKYCLEINSHNSVLNSSCDTHLVRHLHKIVICTSYGSSPRYSFIYQR